MNSKFEKYPFKPKNMYIKIQRINKNPKDGKPEKINPNLPLIVNNQNYIDSFSNAPSYQSYNNQGYDISLLRYGSPQKLMRYSQSNINSYLYDNNNLLPYNQRCIHKSLLVNYPPYVYDQVKNKWYRIYSLINVNEYYQEVPAYENHNLEAQNYKRHNQEAQIYGAYNQKAKVYGSFNQESQVYENHNQEAQVYENYNQKAQSCESHNQEAQIYGAYNQEAHVYEDHNQEAQIYGAYNQEAHVYEDHNQEVQVYEDHNQEVQVYENYNQESQVYKNYNQKAKVYEDHNQEAHVYEDHNQEVQDYENYNQEYQVYENYNQEVQVYENYNQEVQVYENYNQKAQIYCANNQEAQGYKNHNQEVQIKKFTTQEDLDKKFKDEIHIKDIIKRDNISSKNKISIKNKEKKKKEYNSSIEFKIVNYNNKGFNTINENEDEIIVTYSDYDGSKISTKENKEKANDNSKGSSRNNSIEKCSKERRRKMKLKVIFKDLLNYYSNFNSMRIQQKYVRNIAKGKNDINLELLYQGNDKYKIEMSFLNEKKEEIFSKEIKFNCHIENLKKRNYENNCYDGIIDFNLINNSKSNKCIEIPLSENAIEGRKMIKLLLNDISSNISFVEIRQTSMKEIFEKEESCIIELNTDQGEYKYITSISFLNDKEDILFSRILKLRCLYKYLKEEKNENKIEKKLRLIENLIKGVSKNDIIRTFENIGDPKKLNKYLKNKMKNEKFKNDLDELSNKNDMKEICEYCVYYNEQNNKQINPKLLVLCFEYVFMKIISIDKLNTTQYLYGSLEEWKKFLIEFQVGVDCKNIIVISTENGRKRSTESKDDAVEYKRKMQKINPFMDDMKNSKSESHIS